MKRIFLYISIICGLGMVASCSDFFDEDSTYIINANDNHLTNAADTLYSVIGILNKMQAIADRTILLGEARGDLVDVTDVTSKDLRQIATFTVDDENIYNNPEDYYAIINNCNYFIANVNAALKNNRNEYVFRAEYAAVKAIRAWTYLQLVTTYGKVPFVTEPIMTAEQAERSYPMYGIKEICDYFINNDGLQSLTYPNVDYPHYGNIKSWPSRLFYIPMDVILGDLNLWAGNYEQAAVHYHSYLTNRNGNNSAYPTGIGRAYWANNKWDGYAFGNWTTGFSDKSNGTNAEVISIIPTDSIPSEGYYSQLRNIFNTNTDDDDRTVELTYSKRLAEISFAQDYCYYDNSIQKYEIASKSIDWDDNLNGDLRLASAIKTTHNATYNGQRYDKITNNKYPAGYRAVRLYRRTLVYLRLAEALNRAGYPVYAYHILATGVNTDIINDQIVPFYPEEQYPGVAEKLRTQFDFKGSNVSLSGYYNYDPDTGRGNTLGIHSRGCGYTPFNENYPRVKNAYGSFIPKTDEEGNLMTDEDGNILYLTIFELPLDEQIKLVEDMIVDEEALEFAFEGYRYYDLMRVAMRRTDNPTYLADKINARRGEGNAPGIIGTIGDVNSKTNWFLKWGNKVGF